MNIKKIILYSLLILPLLFIMLNLTIKEPSKIVLANDCITSNSYFSTDAELEDCEKLQSEMENKTDFTGDIKETLTGSFKTIGIYLGIGLVLLIIIMMKLKKK